MEKAAGRILKSSNVNFEGRLQLDVNQPASFPSGAKNVTSAMPQACIAENNPEFAIVEIVCSCGTKICLKCEYSGAEAVNPAPA